MVERDVLPDIRGSQPFWRWNSPGAAGLLLFLVYVAISVGTLIFVQHQVAPLWRAIMLAVPWLAVGVGVAGVMLGGVRLWPALFIGSWVVWGVIAGHPIISVTVDAAAEAGSIVLIVRLLSAWGFHRNFDRFRDPIVLLAAAIVGRVLASVIDWMGAFATAWLTPESLDPLYRAILTDSSGAFPALTADMIPYSLGWALNCVAGIMLVMPLTSAKLSVIRRMYLEERISLLGLGLMLPAWGAFSLSLPKAAEAPLLITALMLVAWAAVRFGPFVAAFTTLTLSLIATVGVDLRLGPLASSNAMENLALQWGFIGLLALTGLWLTALLAERRRDLEQLKVVAERYQRLFKASPSPLWVSEPGGGRILMVNEEAMRHYGFSEAEFLAMTVAALAAEPSMIPALTAGVSDGARPSDTTAMRHRTRAGTVIDVELLSTPVELDGRRAELCSAVDVTDRATLRSQILAATQIERVRLAQDLHDGLDQVLTALCLGAQGAAARALTGEGVDSKFVEFLVLTSNEAIKLCRQLTRVVSPLQDANGDLLEALRRLPILLPPDSGPRLEIVIESEAPISLSLERSEHLYRIVQEAVTNALKHAHTAHIRVNVRVTTDTVRINVEDDGVGIQAAEHRTSGLGMRSMELRATAVGATIEVSARANSGTLVLCECPQQEQIETPSALPIALDAPANEQRTTHVESSAPFTDRSAPAILIYLGWCLLLAVACCAGLAVTVILARIIDPHLDVNSSRLAVPSLLIGLSTAGLILGGRRLWPGIFVGRLIGGVLLLHEPWLYSSYYGAAASLTALIILELLSRWQFSRAFDRWQDPLRLCGAAIVGGTCIAAFNFVGMMTYQWLRPGGASPAEIALMTNAAGVSPIVTAAFVSALGRWCADGIAGVVLFVPLLVATPPILRTLHGKTAEVGFWCLALLGWMASLFMLTDASARLPLVGLALVLLVWAVVRIGVAAASLAISLCAMSATVSFALQRGVLTTIRVDEGIDALWGFLALLAGIGMFLIALLAERNRTLRELDATAQRYRRLFAHGPHPLWVQDAPTGRILMVNEQAIRHYGYSEKEWLNMTIDDLAARPASTALVGLISEYSPIETRHRLKSHAVIEVELSYAPIDMDGRPALLCFAIDVTDRNALRRGLIEAADAERRRLADELRFSLGGTLTELELAATHLKQAAVTGHADRAAIQHIAWTSEKAVEVCRKIAHHATNTGVFSDHSQSFREGNSAP